MGKAAGCRQHRPVLQLLASCPQMPALGPHLEQHLSRRLKHGRQAGAAAARAAWSRPACLRPANVSNQIDKSLLPRVDWAGLLTATASALTSTSNQCLAGSTLSTPSPSRLPISTACQTQKHTPGQHNKHDPAHLKSQNCPPNVRHTRCMRSRPAQQSSTKAHKQ